MSLLLLHGDARQMPLADKSVQTVITSPPYYGLRRYEGVEPRVWGGEPECHHSVGELQTAPRRGHPGDKSTLAGTQTAMLSKAATEHGTICQQCGGWREVLGGESVPDCLAWARGEPPCALCYVCHLRTVFTQIWNVLRDDGILWLNLGDSMAGSWGNYAPGGITGTQRERHAGGARWQRRAYADTSILPPTATIRGLKPKNLIGIPWRVALTLQADGWILRSDIIWEKKNAMPESAGDRPTRSHEHVFLFAKQAQYYYDAEAIRETSAEPARVRHDRFGGANGHLVRHGVGSISEGHTTRNIRDVWTIPTQGFAGQHFACFPPALVERCLKAGTSEAGCCPRCRTPYVRQTAKITGEVSSAKGSRFDTGKTRDARAPLAAVGTRDRTITALTTGWAPACQCDAGPPVPCLVLDPFCGSGTTLLVARAMGRDAVGLDASWTYLHEVARDRLSLTALTAWEHGVSVQATAYDDLPLFATQKVPTP